MTTIQTVLRILDRVAAPLLLTLYPRAHGAEPHKVIGSVFFLQKIVGFNRLVPWPAHFTSKILYRQRITLGWRSCPGWSPGCYVQARNGLRIGNNLRMGPNVGLISSDHAPGDYDRATHEWPLIIGDNVWLGMGTVVTPGVSIGDNVIVGANSVVTRDIPSNTIAVGTPCRVIAEKPPYAGYTGEG